MPEVGQVIRMKRTKLGMSQKALGNACELSDSEIMRIEKGRRETPNWKNLCKIAKALQFHPFELLYAAGYISEIDLRPCKKLQGLENLDSNDISCVQLFVDFIISRKKNEQK